MDMRVSWTFRLDLTKEELRLVSKALRGALRTPEERAEALELQKRMLRTKHEALRHALAESQKAIDNIDAAEAAANEADER
jgi:prefoldin subunit 5